MKNADCTDLLVWALPRLGLLPAAFRRVRGQVCKRIRRRLRELGLSTYQSYRAHLEASEGEWAVLDGLCRITVTRFCRERPAWLHLRDALLPELALRTRRSGRTVVRAWSAGCGGGEEPYTLRLVWDSALAPLFPGLRLEIVATDADPVMLRRARAARYRPGSLRELPPDWVDRAFDWNRGFLYLRPQARCGIQFVRQDIRKEMPDGPFELVLCRYLAFTYFDARGQHAALDGILARLRPGGFLMLGGREAPPPGAARLTPESPDLGFWRRQP
ncbi:MAG: hypothetical protein JSU82_06850 [Rhodospirillales bacterium]|nr:MAG: hypothetical protein JSU82_06850 [Rhodospirillales bacterium]